MFHGITRPAFVREYRRFILLFFIGALSYPVVAAPVDLPEQSFKERLLLLTRNHPRTKAAAERLAAALAKARYSGWYYPDPMIGFTYMEAPYKKDPADLSPKAFMETELMISQAIPTPGRLSLESDIVDLEAQKARLRLMATSNELTASFLRDVTAAWRIHHHLDLTRQYLGRFQPILSISGAQYALGKGGLADISMARLSSRNLEEKLQRYEKQHEAAEATLSYYAPDIKTMHNFDAVAGYAEELLVAIKKESRKVAELSPELAMASLDSQIEEKRTTIDKLDYAPDFTIFAKYLRSRPGNMEPPETLPDNRISLGFTMRVPLWSALNNHNNVEESSRLTDAARFQYDDLNLAAEASRRALLSDIESATERIKLYRGRMIPEANRAVLAAREGYQAGSTDFNSLLRVWETLYSLEMEAVELEAERFEKIFELARILNLIQPDPRADSEKKEGL